MSRFRFDQFTEIGARFLAMARDSFSRGVGGMLTCFAGLAFSITIGGVFAFAQPEVCESIGYRAHGGDAVGIEWIGNVSRGDARWSLSDLK